MLPDREEDPSLWRMEGIDVKTGLEYAGQDAELYREILSDYADCIEEQAQAIERAVEERNIEIYTIEVHSLKSTSRTIGALELSNMAKAMEDHGKKQEWEPILGKEEGQAAKKPVEIDTVQRLLSELSVLLEEYDAAGAEGILSDLAAYDFSGTDAAYMEGMTAALGRFDYEACLTIAVQWSSELL